MVFIDISYDFHDFSIYQLAYVPTLDFPVIFMIFQYTGLSETLLKRAFPREKSDLVAWSGQDAMIGPIQFWEIHGFHQNH